MKTAPELERVVVAVDPPASVHGAECGIVVARPRQGRHGLCARRPLDGRAHAHGWAQRVAAAYEDFHADCIVAEANQGGDMVKSLITDARPGAAVRMVHARRGKKTRAEPASMLYESGPRASRRRLPELEDQLCNYDGSGESPDRMDALVWALADLFPGTRRNPPQVRTL